MSGDGYCCPVCGDDLCDANEPTLDHWRMGYERATARADAAEAELARQVQFVKATSDALRDDEAARTALVTERNELRAERDAYRASAERAQAEWRIDRAGLLRSIDTLTAERDALRFKLAEAEAELGAMLDLVEHHTWHHGGERKEARERDEARAALAEANAACAAYRAVLLRHTCNPWGDVSDLAYATRSATDAGRAMLAAARQMALWVGFATRVIPHDGSDHIEKTGCFRCDGESALAALDAALGGKHA